MAKTLNTLRKMNRPIKFFGLSSLQFLSITIAAMAVIIIMVFQQLHPLVMLTVIIGVILGFMFSVGKLNREYKKGNPDYLTSVSIRKATPKKIIDKHNYFKTILIK